jgi:hypothetical protein
MHYFKKPEDIPNDPELLFLEKETLGSFKHKAGKILVECSKFGMSITTEIT